MLLAEASAGDRRLAAGRRLIVFARAPVPGQAKTRLIPALGDTGAAELHARLVEHTVAKACDAARQLNARRKAVRWRVELSCAPDTTHALFKQLTADFDMTVAAQAGDDLGERMHRALGCAGHAVLFGCDCPALLPADIVAAGAALDNRNDAVLGPAADDGYYLIGTRCSDRVLFDGVEWGTDRVIAQTRERLHALEWMWHELPTYPDIDRPEDLVHLPDALR